MRSPTGATTADDTTWGDPGLGAPVLAGWHRLQVPVDHADPHGPLGTLTVCAREVRRADLADTDLPYLVYLQGGPGGRSPRPGADGPGWLDWALARYRVVLLDQRGTGRSTPADRWSLPLRGTPKDQAEYLAHHRADAIVADAEALRRHLLGDVPWSSLGQSFGGFCTWTYLSTAPEGLEKAYVTGGVPPVGATAVDVYRATHRALDRRVAALDAVHPQVRTGLARIARHLVDHDVRLPTGERLTVARLQEIGVVLGAAGGVDLLGHLVADAWSVPGEHLSDVFVGAVAQVVSYAGNPLYALVHEAIYAGPGDVTGWAAERVRAELGVPDAPVPGTAAGHEGAEVLPLTGEMVYRHTVERDPALAPLAEVAELLAQRTWDRPLYDPARLAANRVPVAAMLYTQDMYVDPDLSRATTARTGQVRVVEDDDLHHDGLRRAGDRVLGRLHDALTDEASHDGTVRE